VGTSFVALGTTPRTAGAVHRGAAIVLCLLPLYHVIHLSVNQRDRLFLKAMLPELKDATDLWQVFPTILDSPKSSRASPNSTTRENGILGLYVGTLVMTAPALCLFNNSRCATFPSGVGSATAVHYYEALLATFSILIWHFSYVS